MLDADFGLSTLGAWMRHKFGIETTPDEFRDVEDRRGVADELYRRAEEAYNLEGSRVPRADRSVPLHRKTGSPALTRSGRTG